MKLMKCIKTMVILTALALIYISMQMEIINLAYQGKKKEHQIIELSESAGVLAYNILKLKSSNHLGDNLLKEDSLLRFQDNDNVVKVVTREPLVREEDILAGMQAKKSNPFLNFFPFKAPTEARAEEKNDSLKPWRRTR